MRSSKIIEIFVIAAITAMGLVIGAGSARAAECANEGEVPQDQEQAQLAENALICLVNEARADAGLPPLSVDPSLTDQAHGGAGGYASPYNWFSYSGFGTAGTPSSASASLSPNAISGDFVDIGVAATPEGNGAGYVMYLGRGEGPPPPGEGADCGDAANRVPATPEEEALAEQAVVCLINFYRAQYGLEPLIVNERLALAAREHSYDISVNGLRYDANDEIDPHLGWDDSKPSDRIVDHQAYCADGCSDGPMTGENVYEAWGQMSDDGSAENYGGVMVTGNTLGTPRSAVTWWMHHLGENGHRAAILSETFSELGAGVVFGAASNNAAGATYTVTFGYRGPAAPPAEEEPPADDQVPADEIGQPLQP